MLEIPKLEDLVRNSSTQPCYEFVGTDGALVWDGGNALLHPLLVRWRQVYNYLQSGDMMQAFVITSSSPNRVFVWGLQLATQLMVLACLTFVVLTNPVGFVLKAVMLITLGLDIVVSLWMFLEERSVMSSAKTIVKRYFVYLDALRVALKQPNLKSLLQMSEKDRREAALAVIVDLSQKYVDKKNMFHPSVSPQTQSDTAPELSEAETALKNTTLLFHIWGVYLCHDWTEMPRQIEGAKKSGARFATGSATSLQPQGI